MRSLFGVTLLLLAPLASAQIQLSFDGSTAGPLHAPTWRLH